MPKGIAVGALPVASGMRLGQNGHRHTEVAKCPDLTGFPDEPTAVLAAEVSMTRVLRRIGPS